MKTMFGQRRHQCLAMVSIFLIVVVLVAGIAGCGATPVQYTLTIASTTGGSVTDPGEEAFTYTAGATVSLVAEAEEGYYFARWTGDVDTVSDINAMEAVITVTGDCFITANFVPDGAIPLWDWYDLDVITNHLSGYYVLMNNLDSTTPGYAESAGPEANNGLGWEPIDIGAEETFDGQGYEIRGLVIARPTAYYVGLFGSVARGGVVKNVGLLDAVVIGEWPVAGLVAWNEGTVSNSYSAGIINGGGEVGGLVGRNAGTVDRSHCSGSVAGIEAVGGLVGMDWWESGNVSNSYATASVDGSSSVGGLVGWNGGTVTNCYATGSVTGGGDVGGLVGYGGQLAIDHCFWDIQTSGQSTSTVGTGLNTTEMRSIATFSGAIWKIVAVADASTRNTYYIWNIVDDTTYPFLSWEPVS